MFSILAITTLVLSADVNPAAAQNVSVTGGTTASNDSPASYQSLWISGTGSDGSRSTYTANAALTSTNSIYVLNRGILNANASIRTNYLQVDALSTLNLNSGTLSANTGYFYGQSLNHAGGNYAFKSLMVGDSADVTYGPNDSVTEGLGAYNGSVFRLNRDLNLSGWLNLSNSALVRNGHNITAASWSLWGPSLAYQPGDSVTRSVQVSNGGQLTLERDLILTEQLSLAQPNSLVRNGYAINVGSLYLSGSLTLGPNDNVTQSLGISSGGRVSLERDLVLQGGLGLTGPNGLVRNGHTVAAGHLNLEQGATYTYGTGDSLTVGVQVGYDSTLTLEKDLVLSNDFSVFSGGTLVRNGHSFSAGGLQLFGGQSLEYNADDELPSSAIVRVGGGSQFILNRDLAVGYLQVDGSTGLVKNGHNYSVTTVFLDSGATLSYAAGDAITGGVNVGESASFVLERDLSTMGLSVAGTAGLVTNGHHYSVQDLSLSAGASLSYEATDSITRQVQLMGGGSTLTANRPVSLDQGPFILDGSTLVLNDFSGTGVVNDWALRATGNTEYGNFEYAINYWLNSNQIQTSALREAVELTRGSDDYLYLRKVADYEVTGDTASSGGMFSVLTIGSSGTGGMTLLGGTLGLVNGVSSTTIVGDQQGSVGEATIVDGRWHNGVELIVGRAGTGTFNVVGGVVTSNWGITIGAEAGGVGTLHVTGGEIGTYSTLNVGATSGTGTVLVEGGVLWSGNAVIGASGTDSGTGLVEVTGGIWSHLSNTLQVNSGGRLAVSGSGVLSIAGGTLAAEPGGTISVGPGGRLEIGHQGQFSTSAVLAADVTNDGTIIFDRANDSTYAGLISGTGTVVKQGVGALALTGTSGADDTIVLSQDTTVAGGRLLAGTSGGSNLWIGSGNSGSITIAGGTVSSSWAFLGHDADDVGTATITSGSWGATRTYVGYLGSGTVQMSGGSLRSNLVALGIAPSGQGAVTMNSGDLSAYTLSIGQSGAGTMTVNGGTVSANLIELGAFGGSGTLNITGGSVAATQFWCDVYENSQLNVSGGSLSTADMSVAGTMQVNGGVVTVAGNLGTVGNGSVTVGPAGTLAIGNGGTTGGLSGDVTNNGTLVFNRATDFSYGGSITGTGQTIKLGAGTMTLIVTPNEAVPDSYRARIGTSTRVSEGTLTAFSSGLPGGDYDMEISIGRSTGTNGAPATLTIDGGMVRTDNLVNVGYLSDLGDSRAGAVTITSGTLVANDGLYIGFRSQGSLNLSGGTIETFNSLIGGSWSLTQPGTGSASVSGGSWINSWNLSVGSSAGSGELLISGGYVNSENASFIGAIDTFGRGSVVVTGGQWRHGGVMTVRATGTLAISGSGVVTVAKTLAANEGSTITVGPGGTLQIGEGGTTGVLAMPLAVAGGTLAFNRSDAWTHGLVISGSGSVTKLGPGLLTLSATNTYSGGTQVLAGTLRAANTASFGTGTIVLSSGATLDLADLAFSNTIVNNGGTIVNGGGYDGTQEVTSGTATISGTSSGTVVVDAPNATAEFAGTVTGTVAASNGGTVVITGSVAPTAQVSVGAGSTVTVGNGAAIAQTALTNAGTFAVANTVGSILLPTAITGTGSFEKTGAGTAVLTGSSNFTGGTTISSGVVAVQNTKALGNGGVTVGSGGKLLVDGIALDLGGAAVALGVGASLETTSGARVTISGSSDLSGVRSTAPGSTSAAILAGTSISGTLATTWTTTADSAVKSAVLELKTPTTAANPFVLSLSYALGLDEDGLFLGWNDPVSGDWVNAVVGNELLEGMTAASGSQRGYLGSFATFQSAYGTDLSSYLGAYGRDGTGRTVWAVINHNSEFAVTEINPVPEPGSWALALVGIASAVVAVRRKPSRRHVA